MTELQHSKTMKIAPVGAIVEEITNDKAEEREEKNKSTTTEEVEAEEQEQTIVHLISDFVIELLENLQVEEFKISELAAKLELVTTLEQPEDLMVYLCSIGQKIIESKDGEVEEKLGNVTQPTLPQVQMHAARMTLCYLALLS